MMGEFSWVKVWEGTESVNDSWYVFRVLISDTNRKRSVMRALGNTVKFRHINESLKRIATGASVEEVKF